MLAGRRILLGVTGGIACYKSVDLASRLRKAGAEVRVAMTAAAAQFVAPVTFQAISGNRVGLDLFGGAGADAVDHIRLAEWAEFGVLAPATANVLGKLAHGIADDFLTTTLLALAGPALLVPAMNRFMYAHPAVQANLVALAGMGYEVMPPDHGRLAEGVVGWGRMPEPPAIVERLQALVASGRAPREELPPPGAGLGEGEAAAATGPVPASAGRPSALRGAADFTGVRVLITAGPTQEPLDPVRFLTNPSSGRTGWALAEAARQRGASVVLVAGPVALADPPGVEVRRVRTAVEMADAALAAWERCDVAICAAAVADFRPAEVHAEKIKKGNADELTLRLVRNPDTLGALGRAKGRRVLVGFAAEAGAGPAEAGRKNAAKGADLTVFNDVRRPGLGFAAEDNDVVLVGPDGSQAALGPLPKRVMADRILDRVADLRTERIG